MLQMAPRAQPPPRLPRHYSVAVRAFSPSEQTSLRRFAVWWAKRAGHRAMVLVDSPGVDGPDGPAVLPVADDTDGAAEVPLLPPAEVPPESSSPSMLRNPAAERQLSPSKARLTQRAAEASAPQLEAGEEGDGEGEVGEDERQEGEGAADAEAEAAVEVEAAEEVVAPPSPSKVRRFSQLPQLSAAGGLPKWNQFYTEESVNQRVQLMQHPKVKHVG